MRYQSIISERMLGSTQLVYHATRMGIEILAAKGFEGRTICRVGEKRYDGVCFTRSRDYANEYGEVVFGLDYQAMRQRFRFIPFADDRIQPLDLHGGFRREAEEFVVADFIPLKPYLKAIWLDWSLSRDEDYEILKQNKLYRGTF